jgi:thymidylate synthase (FAD)
MNIPTQADKTHRPILPVAIYTEIYVNCDLHNLMHFLRLRLDSHAQSEIQDVAKAMRKITEELFPWTMAAFQKYQLKVVENE